MKHTIQTKLVTTIIAFCFAALPVFAQDTDKPHSPKPAEEKSPGSRMTDCKVCLRADYVESIKSANFLVGNMFVGGFNGFDAEFAKFSRRGSRELIYIPKSAILYMTGKERMVTF
jgi:hypothetical protein